MEKIARPLYRTTVTSAGGRSGSVRSDDGFLDLPLHAPVELGGPGWATNPEQLFAAGYAACFHSALVLVASTEGIDTSASEVTATVDFGKGAEGQYVLGVTLSARVPGVEGERLDTLLARAHRTCPYSRATAGNVEVVVRPAD